MAVKQNIGLKPFEIPHILSVNNFRHLTNLKVPLVCRNFDENYIL